MSQTHESIYGKVKAYCEKHGDPIPSFETHGDLGIFNLGGDRSVRYVLNTEKDEAASVCSILDGYAGRAKPKAKPAPEAKPEK